VLQRYVEYSVVSGECETLPWRSLGVVGLSSGDVR